MDNKPILDQKQPWSLTPYKRAPWIRPGLKLGATVKPLKYQDNPDISNDAVMRPRDEPVGYSNAFPLKAGGDYPTDGDTPKSRQDLTHDL